MNILVKTGLLFLAVAAMPLWATQNCVPSDDDCVELGKWQLSLGIGLGARTNPLVDGKDIPLVILPMVNYNGERFFIQNLDFGAIVWENEQHQLNLLLTPGYDQIFFNRWDPVNFVVDNSGFATAGGKGKNESDDLPTVDTSVSGSNSFVDGHSVSWRELSERHLAGLGGIEYTYSNALMDLQVQWLKDVTHVHEGEERRIALTHFWSLDRHRLGVSLGATWQSEEIINYYFGVHPDEADPENQYATGSGVSTLLRIDWNYALNKRWDLRALVSYRHLPTEISSSPLVNNNSVVTAFVGGVYHF